MKHFVKKHTHHFGLWALSGLLLIWSIIWLNNLNQPAVQNAPIYKTAEIKSATDSEKMTQKIIHPDASVKIQNNNKKNTSTSAPPLIEQLISAQSVTGPETTPLAPEKQTFSVIFKIITPTTNKEFTLQVLPQNTVYDAMKQLQLQIPVKFKDFGGLGAFVEEIDGLTNDSRANLFWIYYINGQPAKLGVSSIKLNPNDIITWQYEEAKY